VKAIRFAAPVPRYLATLAAGRLSHRFYLGAQACTSYREIDPPALPGGAWVRLRTRLGGICGSDLAVVTLRASPATSPFSSFPFVLGHENVAEVVEVGRAVKAFSVGDRVVANPLLCCEARGMSPVCLACTLGDHSRCAHFTDGDVPPGMLIGTTRDLGGSWGEQFVAHESQLHRVPDRMSDEEAVLVEPFACSVHAVRANLPGSGEQVLVIGAGSIGLLTTAAISALAPEAATTVLARHAFQGAHAARLGAAQIVAARGDYTKELADLVGVRLLQPIIGKPIGTAAGFDRTFVCVGGVRAMEDALRLTRPGGTVVLLGNASTLNGLDWTPLWLKELTLRGSVCYGSHGHGGAKHSAFAEAMALIADRRADVAPLLTQTFPLAEYRAALDAAMDKSGEQTVKIAFRF